MMGSYLCNVGGYPFITAYYIKMDKIRHNLDLGIEDVLKAINKDFDKIGGVYILSNIHERLLTLRLEVHKNNINLSNLLELKDTLDSLRHDPNIEYKELQEHVEILKGYMDLYYYSIDKRIKADKEEFEILENLFYIRRILISFTLEFAHKFLPKYYLNTIDKFQSTSCSIKNIHSIRELNTLLITCKNCLPWAHTSDHIKTSRDLASDLTLIEETLTRLENLKLFI